MARVTMRGIISRLRKFGYDLALNRGLWRLRLVNASSYKFYRSINTSGQKGLEQAIQYLAAMDASRLAVIAQSAHNIRDDLHFGKRIRLFAHATDTVIRLLEGKQPIRADQIWLAAKFFWPAQVAAANIDVAMQKADAAKIIPRKVKKIAVISDGGGSVSDVINIINKFYKHIDSASIASITAFDVAECGRQDRINIDINNLLNDSLPLDSSHIHEVAGCAYVYADMIAELILKKLHRIENDHFLFFHESLAMAMEDRYFRYLRLLKAVDCFLAQKFDEVLIISADSVYLPSVFSIAVARVGLARVRVSARGTGRRESCLAALFDASTNIDKLRPKGGNGLATFAPPRPFYAEGVGPMRSTIDPASGRPQMEPAAMEARLRKSLGAAARLRSLYSKLSEKVLEGILADGNVREFGDPTVDPDEPWLCLIINLDERVYGPLYLELLRRYLPHRKVLVIDHTREGSPAFLEAQDSVFAVARCCRVYNFLALARNAQVPKGFIGVGPRRTFDSIHGRMWNHMRLGVAKQLFVGLMRQADNRAAVSDVNLHLRVGVTSLALFATHRIQAVVGFPSRNTFMRMGIQAARAFGLPSVEAHTLMGGKIVRYRGPNTDRCVLLDTWSRDNFIDYFGYPADRIDVLGALRFDGMIADLESDEGKAQVAAMRETLFGDAAARFPMIVFGSQPVEIERNVQCLRLVLDACASVDDARLVIKLHPAEPAARIEEYRQLAEAALPAGRVVVVTNQVNVMRLTAASDLVVSLFSNILLEAACVDKRACAVNLSGRSSPIDFAGMGVAIELRDAATAPSELVRLVATPPGQHPLDASRRSFLESNRQLVTPGYMDRLVARIDELRPAGPGGESELLVRELERLRDFIGETTVAQCDSPKSIAGEGVSQVSDLESLVTALSSNHGTSVLRFTRFIKEIPAAARAAIESECDEAIAHRAEQDGLAEILVAGIYLALFRADVRKHLQLARLAEALLVSGAPAAARAVEHLRLLTLCLPRRCMDAFGQATGTSAIQPTTARPDVRRVLMLTEGDVDTQVVVEYIESVFPNAEDVVISFLSRPNNVVDRFQDELLPRTDRRYSFIDLLADYTGNYMPTIDSCVGSSYVLGDLVASRLIEEHDGPLRPLLGFLREPLSQGIEDHYYRYLRTLKSVSVMLDVNKADVLMIVAATGSNLPSVFAVGEGHFSRDDIYVSIPVRASGPLENIVEQLCLAAAEDSMPPEDVPPSRLERFRPPPSFCSFVHGPVRPALDDDTWLPRSDKNAYDGAYARLTADAEEIISYFDKKRMRRLGAALARVPVRKYGVDDGGPEPWVLLAVNFDDRVHSTLYEDLVAHYCQSTKLVLLDFSAQRSAAFAAVETRRLRDARCVEVYKYLDLAKRLVPPAELKVATKRAGFRHVHSVVHRDAGIRISQRDLSRVLDRADMRVYHGVLPSHMAVALTVMALVRERNVAKAVICPTRSSYMRIAAQAARLFKVPTLEAQTVLNGRMVRHRAPNTDYCSVLETWSRDYYADFFGYPTQRLLLGGALRYDLIADGVESDLAREAIGGLRESLFPGYGEAPLVVFGTQPMQISDNLFCIERLLEACLAVPETRVVIKVHPVESEANRKTYERTGQGIYPADRLLVTKTVDTYHLMKAADLTVSQTSNILLEAGFLDSRAVSLHFGAYHPPVDFEEMNAAMIIRDPALLPEVVRDLLTAPPGTHWFDARRRRFIDENPQLVDRQYRARIVGFLSRLDEWRDGYESMVAEDKARLDAFNPGAYGWRF